VRACLFWSIPYLVYLYTNLPFIHPERWLNLRRI
jgi:hypothetical protein